MSFMQDNAQNIPLTGPKKYYSYLGLQPTFVLHQMSGTNKVQGELPGVTTAGDANPTVSGGRATWSALTHGGLFKFPRGPVIVEKLHSKNCNPTWTITDTSGTYIRDVPVDVPFELAGYECLKAVDSGNTTAAEVGCIVRTEIK